MAMIGDWTDLAIGMITASGALGTAAAGMVETQKGNWGIGELTRDDLVSTLGVDGWELLEDSYGRGTLSLLQGSFREGAESLRSVLRAGLRLALRPTNAATFARWMRLDRRLTEADVAALATTLAGEGDLGSLDSPSRRTLGEIELRIDALVDAAVATAADRYRARMKALAGGLAIGIGAFVGFAMMVGYREYGLGTFLQGVLIGVLAVPVAPIAKDLTSSIVTVRDALSRRSG